GEADSVGPQEAEQAKEGRAVALRLGHARNLATHPPLTGVAPPVLAVHGDMGAAGAGERLAVPAGPALAQLEPGDARHQVELRRPHVPARVREQTDAV